MNKICSKWMVLVLALVMCLSVLPAKAQEQDVLRLWTENAPAKADMIGYMAKITDPSSESFIPEENRIAVFDLDGTLMCETYPRCFEYMVFVDYALNNPNYTPTEEVRAVAQEILDTAWEEKPSGISTRQAAMAALAYAGMTPDELGDYVRSFMSSPADGFINMTRGEAFYLPMVELVEYLEENGFIIYIVTATERNIVRAIVKDTLGIPPARVIGTEYGYTATSQGDTADGDYTFKTTDKVVFDGNYYGENAKMSKVDAIVREIGQQPVLAFGNSSGDLAMCQYVVTDNPYPALSYIVLADDDAREWGDPANKKKAADYAATGIGAISMRDDFVTIYGEGVLKDWNAPAQEAGTAEDFLAQPRVSYLGPEGTYTEEAAQFFFPDAGGFLPEKTVEEAIEDVTAGRADYGVIPQENTLGGVVVNYVDALLAQENIFVVGEVILPISQTLMGVPGASLSDIQTVCSHAQGLTQSAQWRKEHLPDAEAREMPSTAAAASFVAETGDKTVAAVAAPGAAALYGLDILAENVQITDANKTRFYVLSASPLEPSGYTRAVFTVSCEASRLDDILLAIRDTGLELVTLHVRPEGSKLGIYNYLIETEAADGISPTQLESVSALEGVRCLGCFDALEK